MENPVKKYCKEPVTVRSDCNIFLADWEDVILLSCIIYISWLLHLLPVKSNIVAHYFFVSRKSILSIKKIYAFTEPQDKQGSQGEYEQVCDKIWVLSAFVYTYSKSAFITNLFVGMLQSFLASQEKFHGIAQSEKWEKFF